MDMRKLLKGCLIGFLAVTGVSVILIGLLVFAGFRMAKSMHLHPEAIGEQEAGQDENPSLNEVWSAGSGDVKVVLIPIRGLIQFGVDGGWLSGEAGSAEMALRSIRRATRDPAVKAIILDVDSGGGGITASDILYKELMDFRDSDEDRRVVALFGDIAASGAYYISLAADRIIARPTTITGSIGVLIQTLNLRELGVKLGVKDVTIKSGRNKDMLNPMQDLSPEQAAMLQGLVDELHSRFAGLVAERRGLKLEDVASIADGRVFSAGTAQKLGLVDTIGYWDDAMAEAAGQLGVDEVKVYRYEEPFSFSSLSAFLQSSRSWNPIRALEPAGHAPRFMYLWEP